MDQKPGINKMVYGIQRDKIIKEIPCNDPNAKNFYMVHYNDPNTLVANAMGMGFKILKFAERIT